MKSRKWILISLGASITMVLLGAFLRHSAKIPALKPLAEKAESLVRSPKNSVAVQAPAATADKSAAGVDAAPAASTEAPNEYADWELERLEKEAVSLKLTEKLNSKDLPAEEREQLSQLVLALQNARQVWIDAEMQRIQKALTEAEGEHQKKLAETREKISAVSQNP